MEKAPIRSRARGAIASIVAKMSILYFFVGFMLAGQTEAAWATSGTGLGSLASSDASNNFDDIISVALKAAFMGGIFMFIFGIYHMVKAHKSQGRDGKMSEAGIMMGAGALLTLISYGIGVIQNTLFSSGGSGAQSIVTMSTGS